MRAPIRLALLLVAVAVAGCGGGSPSTPTPPGTRIIGLTGSLTFGSIVIGTFADQTFTISNSGNSPLTITSLSISVPPGPDGFTTTWASGTIPAAGSQAVTIRFRPTEVKSYGGTLTINGDQTSGTNTIGMTGTGVVSSGG